MAAERTLKVAWLGPAPTDAQGVPYAGGLIIRGLLKLGHSVDCYAEFGTEPIPAILAGRHGLRIVTRRPRWRPDRWYSRGGLSRYASGLAARSGAQTLLAGDLVKRHAERPYDVLYQFSQIELLGLRARLGDLPPLVLHPQVHAAGELRWVDAERDVAPQPTGQIVRAALALRARHQRRDMQHAALTIAASEQFAQHLVSDCDLASDRLRVVANPVDVERFAPTARNDCAGSPFTVLFVSRLAVRKGVDIVVELSQRLADLAGRMRIVVAGAGGEWSDYSTLLDRLDPLVGEFRGYVEPTELPALYAQADVLVQPSRYEPFALTVGEALACGLPVIASSAVGASEHVNGSCCTTVATVDAASFEREIRAAMQRSSWSQLRMQARREAVRAFAPDVVAAQVAGVLGEAAG